MFKKIFLIVLTLMTVGSFCFAEEVYIGDNEEYAIYLLTETIRYDTEFTPGTTKLPITILYSTIKYSTTSILEKTEYSEILCFDNDWVIFHTLPYIIDYYKATSYIDIVTAKLTQPPYIILEKSTMFEQNDSPKYNTEDNSVKHEYHMDFSNPRDKIYQHTFNEVINYIKKHEISRENLKNKEFNGAKTNDIVDTFLLSSNFKLEKSIVNGKEKTLTTVFYRMCFTPESKKNNIYKEIELTGMEFAVIKEQYDFSGKSSLLEIIYCDKNNNVLRHIKINKPKWKNILSNSLQANIYEHIISILFQPITASIRVATPIPPPIPSALPSQSSTPNK